MPPDQAISPDTIRSRAGEIRAEFDRILAHRGIVTRPNALQWKFLRHCFEALMSGKSSDFPCDKTRAAQYRFEADDRLARHYARYDRPPKFAFALRHVSHAARDGTIGDDYPQSNGYVLLVSDLKGAYLTTPERKTRELLERVVADAIDAEFAAYRALPKIELAPLENAFVKSGGAYDRIKSLVVRHHDRRWTISNPNNPSTRRLLAIKRIELTGSKARVRTEEYWYLRWWSLKKKKYAYIYNFRNFQTYILVNNEGRWLVDTNSYPSPRESASRRKPS